MTDDLARRAGRDASATPFKSVALVLQGGGALGSYQGGVYQALAEANVHPDWVSGISIGAVNSALIAGNAPEKRVEKLREFWETVSKPPLGPFGTPYNPSIKHLNETVHRALNQFRAFGIAALGAPGFFRPRVPSPVVWPAPSPAQLSHYDVAPLKETLERLVDFDRLNSGESRLSVGAVNVRNGNFTYFDTTTHRIDFRHIMASGSLPPGFPATEIDGEYYWDGGIVSNTPLQWVLDRVRARTPSRSRSTCGAPPANCRATFRKPRCGRRTSCSPAGPARRRTRFSTRSGCAAFSVRFTNTCRKMFVRLPEVAFLAKEADESVYNIVHLIYHAEELRGHGEGLRVLAPHHGRALERRLHRRAQGPVPSRSAATPAQSRGLSRVRFLHATADAHPFSTGACHEGSRRPQTRFRHAA